MSGKSTEEVSVRLKAERQRQFSSDMKGGGRAVRGVGNEADKTRGKFGRLSKSSTSLSRVMKGGLVAGVTAGIAGIAGAVSTIRSSVNEVESLAKGSAQLSRTTGMDTKTASEWVSTAKIRGVEAGKLNMGFVKLAQNVTAAQKGLDKQKGALAGLGGSQKDQIKRNALIAKGAGAQADAFKALGVSQSTLASGDINRILAESADGFASIPDGANKAALAQKLFGKQSQTLLPLLNKGSKALSEQLGLADKYGATIDKNGAKKALEAAAAQRELNLAFMGLKIMIGTQVVPWVMKGTRAFADLVSQLRSSTEFREGFAVFTKVVAKLGQTASDLLSGGFKKASTFIRDTIDGFNKGRTGAVLLVAALTGLTAAWVTYKAAMVATSAALKAYAAIQTIVNVIMTANPIGVAVLAVVALGVAFVVAYKKLGGFRNAIQGVFGWVKKNWPLLLAILTGPLGLAVLVITKNVHKIANKFRDLKALVGRVFSFIAHAPGKALGKVGKLAGKLGGVVGLAQGGLVGYAQGGHVAASDTQMAALTPGEYVTKRSVVKKVGIPFMNALNSGALMAGAGGDQTQHFNLYIDGKQVNAVVERTSTNKARRRP